VVSTGLDLNYMYLASAYLAYMICFLPRCRSMLVMKFLIVDSGVRFVKVTVAVAQLKVPKMDSACQCLQFETHSVLPKQVPLRPGSLNHLQAALCNAQLAFRGEFERIREVLRKALLSF